MCLFGLGMILTLGVCDMGHLGSAFDVARVPLKTRLRKVGGLVHGA